MTSAPFLKFTGTKVFTEQENLIKELEAEDVEKNIFFAVGFRLFSNFSRSVRI